MTKRLLVVVSLVFVVGLSIAVAQQRSASAPSIQGAWRLSEAVSTGPNAATNRQPQPGFIIFTAKHYAQVTVTGAKPRPDVADFAKATADELRGTWGPFTANAGTYEVSGDTLTTRALVAKNPGVMSAGNYSVRSMKLEGNTLTLTQTRTHAGPTVNPTTIKLTRAE